MPIGAIIGGVASIGGALLSSASNKKAIDKTTAAQAESNAASIALQRDIYGQNRDMLAPYDARGNAAGAQINALLGLGGQAAPPPLQAQPAAMSYYGEGFDTPGNVYGGNARALQDQWLGSQGWTPDQYDGARQFAIDYGPSVPPQGTMQYGQHAPAQPVAQPGQTPQQAAEGAFDIFKNSTGYQSRLNEAYKGLNTGYAANGLLESGAAQRRFGEVSQDYASNELARYMGYLTNQQGVGLSGASAVAGVGQNYANNITALNQSNADAIGNGALARASNNNALYGSIAGAVGNVFGGLGSSYRR